jgi:two-component system LytT family response regulator
MENIMQLQPTYGKPISFSSPHQKGLKIRTTRSGKERKKVRFSTDKHIYFIDPQEIIRCQSQGNYCTIYLRKHSPLLISKTLKYVTSLLPAFSFIRTHQSHLINIEFIHKIQKNGGYQMELENGTIIPISRASRASVLDFLNNN